MSDTQIGLAVLAFDLLLLGGLVWIIYRFVRRIPGWIAQWRERGAADAVRRREIRKVQQDTLARAGPNLYRSPCSRDIIALNRETRQMIVGTLGYPVYVPFEKIVHAEIVTGDALLTQTDPDGIVPAWGRDMHSQTIALKSAIAADRLSRDLITDLSIRVTVDDWERPVHSIRFLEVEQGGVDPRSEAGVAAIGIVQDIYAKLALIIRENKGAFPAASPLSA